MNLFLASNAFETLQLLMPRLKQSSQSLKVAFVPTAAGLDEKPWWQTNDRNKLQELGFNVTDVNLDAGFAADALSSYDMVFVAGGNTFYLLQQAQQVGFLDAVRRHVSAGKWYVGSSAGSVLAGPDIGPVHFVDNPEDAPELRTTMALGLIPEVVIPHANLVDREAGIDSCIAECRKLGLKPLPIHDKQAVLVQDGKSEILTA
jgi:dipeptidase E